MAGKICTADIISVYIMIAGTSGYQQSGLSAGQHTDVVRATSTVAQTLQTTVTLQFHYVNECNYS